MQELEKIQEQLDQLEAKVNAMAGDAPADWPFPSEK